MVLLYMYMYMYSIVMTSCIYMYLHYPGGGYPKLMGVAWHTKWENFGLITSAEGLVRELVAYDKMALVRTVLAP